MLMPFNSARDSGEIGGNPHLRRAASRRARGIGISGLSIAGWISFTVAVAGTLETFVPQPTICYHLTPSAASQESEFELATFAEPLVSISKSGHIWLTAPSRISGETGQNERNGALLGE